MNKEKAFQKKCRELIKKANALEDSKVRGVISILNQARKDVVGTIAGTEWESYRLKQMQTAIERAMQEFGDKYGIDLREAQRDLFNLGVDFVDLPLREIGIYVAIPEIDATVLGIMQGYSSDLVQGLTRDAVRRINNELTMGLIGQKSPYDVMKSVGANLKDKSIFKSIAARAETITRNECGRVLEMASQARREKAAQVIPGLKKQWIHGQSSRIPRITHLAADGQIQDVDTPFLVGGEKLMYPRDPGGSAKNTINCSCYSIPYHDNWTNAAEGEDQRAAAAANA